MSLYEDVLARLESGETPGRIADAVDRRPDAIEAMIEEMRRRGHLTRIDCSGTACDRCPVGGSCSMAGDVPAQYVVSRDGQSLLAADGETPSEATGDG
ncbi:hypothetical protein HSBGL_0604 [Halapricum desulfuricans]|uniref:Transcriptional regulator HTH-type FeoC domain-containing protein n=1 Tax=Halapricum desulfuricans TaxID=2841257 RepID=A0A897NJI6_9EURY|nr:FeoC-like transcriptional regulator [Halapricum desulfuricans]QSG11039.1 hypothetical protein HSBGL_0604 [Halapricum desulfuricans]